MGGQACILYGAAEFSRDLDVAILASDANVHRLQSALVELKAEPVFVPPISSDVLRRGHACLFRVHVRGADGLRLDVMSVLHGCDSFAELWARRQTLRLPDVGHVHVLSLADLVQAKKTQRDKDWPMVRRLVEADFHNRSARPSQAAIVFWLREGRSSALLLELCRRYPRMALRVAHAREAVRWALRGDPSRVEQSLRAEEEALRASDRAYWQPLRAELFQWRQKLRKT
jgi:hypothetical protein